MVCCVCGLHSELDTVLTSLLSPVGVYGDVVRVKILYNKRDSALVQFKEPQHSQTGELIALLYSELFFMSCTGYCFC